MPEDAIAQVRRRRLVEDQFPGVVSEAEGVTWQLAHRHLLMRAQDVAPNQLARRLAQRRVGLEMGGEVVCEVQEPVLVLSINRGDLTPLRRHARRVRETPAQLQEQ